MPLRFLRPVMALIATGTAAVTIGLSGVPAAHADQIRHKEWWLRTLGVTGAWAATQGAGVTVAVLSDGVDASHADLTGAVAAAPALTGAPRASGRYFGEQGTPIASLIAGRGHGSGGSSGILGVAPAARILSLQVTLPADDPQLSQSSVAAAIPNAIAAGIKYAVSHGASVIDLPIDPGQPGSSGTGGASAAAGGSPAEQAAVSYALAHNVVLVAPAGDDGASSDSPNYPAAYPGVISVGAFDSAVTKAPWSSHQGYVTVTAAGAGVTAAASAGGYQTVNSTSAASAMVAGIVALIRAQYPGLSVNQVRHAITSSTVYGRAGGRTDGSGYGTVNADKAMAAAATLAMPAGARAGAGAQPPVAPAAVSAVSPTQGIGSQLIRAGEISAALFALLLLLIAAYAATGRRRRRPASQPAVTAQWAHRQGQSRYPQVAAADADRMLEVFTSPVSEPDRGALAGASGFGSAGGFGSAHGGWADDGLFAPAGGRLADGAIAGPPMAADSAGWQSHGPATRAVSRRPAVSGAPPWEPASAPHTELPWTAAPGRNSIPGMPVPAALPGPSGPDSQDQPPSVQSMFHPDGQPSAQRGPDYAGPPDQGHQATPAQYSTPQYSPSQYPTAEYSTASGSSLWDSPADSPAAAYDTRSGLAATERGDVGWDGGRWSPAPAPGPVIEGSVLGGSGRADYGRQGWAAQAPFDEPRYDEPRYDEPRYDEPRYDEPRYDEPRYDEPRYDEPQYEEPQYEEPQHGQPARTTSHPSTAPEPSTASRASTCSRARTASRSGGNGNPGTTSRAEAANRSQLTESAHGLPHPTSCALPLPACRSGLRVRPRRHQRRYLRAVRCGSQPTASPAATRTLPTISRTTVKSLAAGRSSCGIRRPGRPRLATRRRLDYPKRRASRPERNRTTAAGISSARHRLLPVARASCGDFLLARRGVHRHELLSGQLLDRTHDFVGDDATLPRACRLAAKFGEL